MSTALVRMSVLAAVIAAVPAMAQVSTELPATSSVVESSAISPAQLAAGVRGYPARVLRSLLLLAEDPLLLRQLSDEPGLLERPEEISPPVTAQMCAAIRELSVMPAIVAVSAAHPAELQALRELYAQAPQEMEERIVQLWVAYERAELEAAAAWQKALERDPAALDEYREVVTRFCQAQREAYEDFPCVQVLEREYYYACPPHEAIILYALEHAESSAAMRVIEQWWEKYAPYELDARILSGNREPVDFEIGPDIVAALMPEQRAAMWKTVQGDYDDSVGLVPVIMQPPADQPLEAHYARAVAEQARLWTAEPPLAAPEEPVVEGEAEGVHIDDWGYVEEPAAEVVYDDGGWWDYPSSWVYGPSTYSWPSYRSYHVYYAPLAGYYCGYPVDWPLFLGCDPGWLVRLHICAFYCGCGHRGCGHRLCRASSTMDVCYDHRGWAGGHYDRSTRHDRHGIIRIGRRSYHRCGPDRIAQTLGDRRADHTRELGHLERGSGHAWWTGEDSRRAPLRPDVHVQRPGSSSQTTGEGWTRSAVGSLRRADVGAWSAKTGRIPSNAWWSATQTDTRNHSALRDLGVGSARPGWTLRRLIGERGPSNETDRVSPSRDSGSRRSPSISERHSPSSGSRGVVTPRRDSGSHGSPSSSERRSPSSKSSPAVTPRRDSGSHRSPSVSERRSASSGSRGIVTPRRESGSRQSPSISERRSPSSKSSPAVTPRRDSGSHRSPSISERRSPTSKSKSVVAPRRSGSSHRSSSVSRHRPASSKSEKVVSPRRR
jgi:hypothetical protein